MKSPRDPQAELIPTELMPGLDGHTCPTTGGVWIDLVKYWEWFRAQPGFPKPIASFESPIPVDIEDDHEGTVLSPRTGRIMRKCRAGSGLGFRIDYEPSSGFWLDKGEFDSLRSHNLHDELHLICSPEYQLELVRLRSDQAEQSRFEQRLGEENCERIRSFANWFAQLNDESIAMTYLMACIEDERDRV